MFLKKGRWFCNSELQIKCGENARHFTALSCENRWCAYGRMPLVTVGHLVSYSVVLWNKELEG